MKTHPLLTRLNLSGAVLALLLFCPGSASEALAQTLKLRFGFEDSGTSTIDQVAAASLSLVNTAGAATDLHSAAGSGVGGFGKALDLTAGTMGGNGPSAFTTSSTAVNFGSVTSFTTTIWLKPAATTTGFPRYSTIGVNGTGDTTAANSFVFLANGSLASEQSFLNGVQSMPNMSMTLPLNQWQFVAATWDGTTLSFYGGNETNAASFINSYTPAATSLEFGSAFRVFLGNNNARSRCFKGYLDDYRFYTGAGDLAFVENIRQAAALPAPVGAPALGCSSQVTLSWSASAQATNFVIARSGSSGAETNYAATTLATFIDTNVTVGRTYYYVVSAVYPLGTSATSAEVSATVSAGNGVVITVPPADQAVCLGSTATFAVGASGSVSSYNWQVSTNNGVTWADTGAPGAPAFVTPPTTLADDGTRYRVIITGACGAQASESAGLTVTTPVAITGSPVDRTVGTNWAGTAAFTVQATGGALAYQWRQNGMNLTNSATVSGATNAMLVLSAVGVADSGSRFDVVVNNPCNLPQTSSAATLTVTNDYLQLAFGFDDSGVTAADSVAGVGLNIVDASGSPVDLHGAAGSGVAGLGKSLDFTSGVQGGSGPLASTVGNSTLDFGTVNSFTITLWLKPASALLAAAYPRFFSLGVNGTTDRGTANSLQLLSNGPLQPGKTSIQGFVNTSQSDTVGFGAIDLPTGQWRFLALTYDGDLATMKLYGGSQTNAVALTSTTGFPAGPVNLGNAWTLFLGNNLAQNRAFNGELDDVRFYRGAAPLSYLDTVRQSTALPAPIGLNALGCSGRVTLDWSAPSGATGFIVSRSGSSGAETNYATTAVPAFTDQNVTLGATYYYVVTATNALGPSRTSAEVHITVSPDPGFTWVTLPASQAVCEGSAASFSVVATGTVLNYNWQSSGNGLVWDDTGAPSLPNYTTPPVAAADNGKQYRVLITSTCGTAGSPPVTLSVTTPVTITASPVSQVVGTNWPASFAVAATGGVLRYQWRRNGTNLVDSANVSGSTTPTLVFGQAAGSDSGSTIDCLINNPCNVPATSNPATLTVTNTLRMEFAFEDSGVATVDSVAGVSLDTLDGTGSPVDLHGPAGSGVGGVGQTLDFGSAAAQGGSGPIAMTQGNSAIDFGTVPSFTATLWLKPASSLLTAGAFPRFFSLGVFGTIDRATADSLQLLNNANGQPTTSVQGFVNLAQTSTTSFGAFDMPTGKWSFLAMSYDAPTASLNFYGGSETSAVALRSSASFAAGMVNLGNLWTLFLGNRSARDRAFQGQFDDVRFYVGAAPMGFLETVRQSVAPPLPPNIVANARGANLDLRIETLAGAAYILQSTPDLKPPVIWTPVLTNSGTGGTLTNTVPLNPAAAPRFFRFLAR